MFQLKFSPIVIKHLGLSMYSTLPPVLSELITNSYDADADKVTITINQQDKSIILTTLLMVLLILVISLLVVLVDFFGNSILQN